MEELIRRLQPILEDLIRIRQNMSFFYETRTKFNLFPKRNSDVASYKKEVTVDAAVNDLLQFDTIYNLYYSEESSTPVDAATLNEFNQNTGNNIEHAYLYVNPDDYEDMLRRIFLAVVVLDKIHVMPGHYKPESEEGRKLLAHELTHVAQNQNKEFVDHRTREELEEEAEANERTAESIQDPLVTRVIDGKEYTLPVSRWHNVSEDLFDYLPQWLDYERFIRPPEEYEILKKKYAQWMEYKSYKYRW